MQEIKQALQIRKSIRSTMFLIIVGFWIVLNMHFVDKYIQMIEGRSGWIEILIAIVVVSWIVFTSFYASFHLMSFLFSLMVRRKENRIVRNYGNTPPVAILYPCMNDIKEKSIVACLTQDYPKYTLYILDDSTVRGERQRVDALQKKYGERVSVIRRENRNGFKAGNLNNAVREIGDRYEYVCVVDADELIPPTFLRETVAIAEADKDLGFVQTSHQQYGETEYGKRTGDGIDLHWNYFLPARNRFGFVYFYGHGALLRVKAIKAIGGFPEVVSEDLALATKMREVGYRGYYAHDIKCLEEAPPSYRAFRRRNRKITSGTLEFLTKFYPSFFRSPGVPFVEKIDLLIASSIIYLPIPFVCFLFLLHCVMPLVGGGIEAGTASSFIDAQGLYLRKITAMFQPLWNLESMVFIFFTVFAPLCYLIPDALRSPKRVILYFLRMGAIHLSTCLHTVGTALSWFVTRRALFIPTGDRSQRSSSSTTGFLEFLIGLGVVGISILTKSLCLLAVGFSLTLVPFLIKNNLGRRLSSTLTIIPMLMTIIALCGMPILLVGAAGMFAGLALAHH